MNTIVLQRQVIRGFQLQLTRSTRIDVILLLS